MNSSIQAQKYKFQVDDLIQTNPATIFTHENNKYSPFEKLFKKKISNNKKNKKKEVRILLLFHVLRLN